MKYNYASIPKIAQNDSSVIKFITEGIYSGMRKTSRKMHST